MNSKSALIATTAIATTVPVLSTEERIFAILERVETKLDDLYEKVEALEIRVADMDLDTGGGYEIE